MKARIYFAKKWNDDGLPWFSPDLPFACDIYMNFIDYNRLANTPEGVKKVFIDINEPTFYGMPITELIQNIGNFDVIITKHSQVLKMTNKATTDLLASTMISQNNVMQKEATVSFLCTSKTDYNGNTGYAVRHELWKRQNEITFPKRFWSSQYHPVDKTRMLPSSGDPKNNDKIILFQSMFSICPENSSEENYLTEKIIDCFVTGTVPIYRGCTNFSEFFNPDGVIFFTDIEDLITKVNALTPHDYFSRLKAMKENYDKASSYLNFSERMQNKIISVINGNL